MMLTSKISRNRLDKKVSQYASDKKTLEIGSYGRPSYGRFFPNRTGVDIRKGIGVDIVASVYELPFKDNEFDNVLCMSVMEHLEDPKKAITEIKRVLKPDGRIILSVPFLFPIHDAPNDFWRFTKYGLKVLFKDWNIEKIEAETDLNDTFAVLFQRVGYQVVFKMNKLIKVLIFSLANLVAWSPRMTKTIYGGIDRKMLEPEAFASAFFLVANK